MTLTEQWVAGTVAIRPDFRYIVVESDNGLWPPTYTVKTNWGQEFPALCRHDLEACIAEMERQGAKPR